MALAKRNFGEISFRDETEKVYLWETTITHQNKEKISNTSRNTS
jgi:hypothetical protein